MTDPLHSPKIKSWHLERSAIVYIRQSDPQQPVKHPESTARQYALVDRAVALGWPRERVIVIDDDQGKSGSTAEARLSRNGI
jgi:DNA invertase Pin-like site-specific DNA recombinase